MLCPKRPASAEGQGSGWPWLPAAPSSWREISHQDSGSLEEEDLSLGESLCKAHDPHLFKVEEGYGMCLNGV